MAFATANVTGGVQGNVRYMAGDWTGSQGDASGSVVVQSGRILGVDFWSEDADSPKGNVSTSISYSSGQATISVHNHMDVASGRFKIEFA